MAFHSVGENELGFNPTLSYSDVYEKLAAKKASKLKIHYKRRFLSKLYAYRKYEGYSCPKCKCPYVRLLYSLQVRKADEAAFRYFRCRDCKKKSHKSE